MYTHRIKTRGKANIVISRSSMIAKKTTTGNYRDIRKIKTKIRQKYGEGNILCGRVVIINQKNIKNW